MAVSSEQMVLQLMHQFDLDMDRCRCGGLVVYFEDGDKFGEQGHGCELGNIVFSDEVIRERGH